MPHVTARAAAVVAALAVAVGGTVRALAPRSGSSTTIPLPDSSDAQVGDPVVAIGSAFGLPGTVTAGSSAQSGAA